MHSKDTLRRRVVWLFVVVVCLLVYAAAANAKGGGLSRGAVMNSGIHKTCVSQGSVVVVRSDGKIVEKCPEK